MLQKTIRRTRKDRLKEVNKMKQFKTMAHINSLGGKMAEITVLDKPNENENKYIVEYGGVKCSAIFNYFVCEYYADDIYGIIKESD